MVVNLFFQGSVPLISAHGLHQLRIFIFFLAVFHVVYSVITMLLRRMKVEGVHIDQVSIWFCYFISLKFYLPFADASGMVRMRSAKKKKKNAL